MCLIIYKPAGEPLPPDREMAEAIDTNKDGFGYMYLDSNKVHIIKGAMNPKEAEDLLKKLPKGIKTMPMVLHFRTASHGSISPQNCHPYPISSDEGELSKLEIECNTGIAHNGNVPTSFVTVSSTHRCLNITDDKDELSDTALFVKEFLAPMGKALFNHLVLRMLIITGKIALLDSKRGCTLIGEFIKDNKRFYSNSTYKEISYPYYQNGNGKGKFISPAGASTDRLTRYYEELEDERLYSNQPYGGSFNIGGVTYQHAGYGDCNFCTKRCSIWHVDATIGDLCWDCLTEWQALPEEDKEDLRKAILMGTEFKDNNTQIMLTPKAKDVDEIEYGDDEVLIKQGKYQQYKNKHRKNKKADIFEQGF